MTQFINANELPLTMLRTSVNCFRKLGVIYIRIKGLRYFSDFAQLPLINPS